MRVKISYSVNFDDVPDIVKDKIHSVSTNLEAVAASLKPDHWRADLTLLNQIDHIDSMRKKLADLDAQLEDCYSILAGYNKALADMRLPKAESVEETPNDGS